VAAPNRSSGNPSASTIVARTVMVPSLASAALWIFTTTPVFPRDVTTPLRGVVAAKSIVFLTGWWSSANAVLKKTTGASASRAPARCFFMSHSYLRIKGPKQMYLTAGKCPHPVVGFAGGENAEEV